MAVVDRCGRSEAAVRSVHANHLVHVNEQDGMRCRRDAGRADAAHFRLRIFRRMRWRMAKRAGGTPLEPCRVPTWPWTQKTRRVSASARACGQGAPDKLREHFAALNTGTGEVLGKTAARHTSEQFVTFLEDIVASQSPRREIHVICDNVSSHKTPLVQAFLTKHRRVHMHYAPTYSSWLNQVENRFARVQATSSRAVSSPPSKTSTRSSCTTSVSTTKTQNR